VKAEELERAVGRVFARSSAVGRGFEEEVEEGSSAMLPATEADFFFFLILGGPDAEVVDVIVLLRETPGGREGAKAGEATAAVETGVGPPAAGEGIPRASAERMIVSDGSFDFFFFFLIDDVSAAGATGATFGTGGGATWD
jgi:hypothetical protein